jgi:hypothetical protein
MPFFLLYTAKERALSGVYNVARGNIDLESCYINVNGRQSDAVFATDAEVRLQFDGFDEEKMEGGFAYAYYTGSFRLVGNDGKTYVAKFMETLCYSGDFDDYNAGNASYVGMIDENPDYFITQSVEAVVTPSKDAKKVLRNGQLMIIRDGKTYNVLGTPVK